MTYGGRKGNLNMFKFLSLSLSPFMVQSTFESTLLYMIFSCCSFVNFVIFLPNRLCIIIVYLFLLMFVVIVVMRFSRGFVYFWGLF